MKKQIALKDLRIDGGTQQRDIDDIVVNHYAELMEARIVFPPMDVIYDGKNYWLWDGFHRYFAAKKLNRNWLDVEVANGTQRQAVWLSFSANKNHGMPRPVGLVKEIIEKILADEKWNKISEVKIAEHVGVTQQYVSKVKKELSSHPTTSCRIEGDSTPKTPLSRSDTLKVERGGKEYEMKKPAKKVIDSTGKEVPAHLVEVFNRAGVFRDMVRQLTEMHRTVREGQDKHDKLFAFIKIENLEAAIGNLKRIFRFALPYAVCRYCGADHSEDCRACSGNGFVNEEIYLATPKDLK